MYQRLLRALIALEQLGREPSLPVLRHLQLDLADPGDQRACVVAGPIAEPSFAPLPLLRAERLRHLGFQRLLHGGLDQRLEELLARRQKLFDGRYIVLIFVRVMVVLAPLAVIVPWRSGFRYSPRNDTVSRPCQPFPS